MRTADIQIGEVYAYKPNNRHRSYRQVRVLTLQAPGTRLGSGLPSATIVFLDAPSDHSSTRKRGETQSIWVREMFPLSVIE